MNEQVYTLLLTLQHQVQELPQQGSSPEELLAFGQRVQDLLSEALPALLEGCQPRQFIGDASVTSPLGLSRLARAVKRWDDHTGFLPGPPNMLYLLRQLQEEGFAVTLDSPREMDSQAA